MAPICRWKLLVTSSSRKSKISLKESWPLLEHISNTDLFNIVLTHFLVTEITEQCSFIYYETFLFFPHIIISWCQNLHSLNTSKKVKNVSEPIVPNLVYKVSSLQMQTPFFNVNSYILQWTLQTGYVIIIFKTQWILTFTFFKSLSIFASYSSLLSG